jgi:hypothetical protein
MTALNFVTTDLLPALALSPNTNAQGEILRAIVFDQSNGEHGCYTTFETNPEFKAGDIEWRREFWRDYSRATGHLDADDIEEMATLSAGGGQVVFADCKVHAAWYWDGDGTLAFVVTDLDGNIIHAFINTDCKKNHVWNRE